MHKQAGSISIILGIVVLITVAIGMGFVIGALTDPNRSADIRSKASEQPVPIKARPTVPCPTKSLRWYTIQVVCE